LIEKIFKLMLHIGLIEKNKLLKKRKINHTKKNLKHPTLTLKIDKKNRPPPILTINKVNNDYLSYFIRHPRHYPFLLVEIQSLSHHDRTC